MRRLESVLVPVLVLVLMVSDRAFVLAQCARKVTSGTTKRDVRRRQRSGKADERSGSGQRVGAVPVPVPVPMWMVVMMRRRVSVGMIVFRVVVVVLWRMARTRMVAIIGEGVIIARHRSSKAGVGVMPGFLTVRGE